jgi:hypothetical protein
MILGVPQSEVGLLAKRWTSGNIYNVSIEPHISFDKNITKVLDWINPNLVICPKILGMSIQKDHSSLGCDLCFIELVSYSCQEED